MEGGGATKKCKGSGGQRVVDRESVGAVCMEREGDASRWEETDLYKCLSVGRQLGRGGPVVGWRCV